MRPCVLLDAVPCVVPQCDKTAAAIDRYIADGDAVTKIVHCAHHYGAALFRSGRLVLLAPECPEKHATIMENGDSDVLDVAAGAAHIVFCKKNGTVCSFGFTNRNGQLGDGTVWESHSKGEGDEWDVEKNGVPQLSSPRFIHGFGEGVTLGDDAVVLDGKCQCVPIVAVACGAYHTLLLTKRRNCVYGCGLGAGGQLGGKRCPLIQPSFRSIRLLFGLPIRQIAAAGNHSFVLLETGKLLAFGENTCGQLGFGNTINVTRPTEVIFKGDSEKKKSIQQPTRAPFALDSVAIKSLRAAWGTAESIYFPLRVERLSAELDANEPFILSVWCSAFGTVVLTRELKWLSCGFPLSRNPSDRQSHDRRMDNYGVLGRWIQRKEEAYSFNLMCWSQKLSSFLVGVFPSLLKGEAEAVNIALDSMRVVCTTHAIVVLIPDKGGVSHLFVQGNRQGASMVVEGSSDHVSLLSISQSGLDQKLLLDYNSDDDSCQYALVHAQAIISSDRCLAVM